MDAIKLLKADHDKVKELLKQLASTTARAAKKRVRLSEQIKRELEIHSLIETEIFYPVFRSAGDGKNDDKLYFEALEEHHAVGDLVLPDLVAMPVESEKFAARATVLKELVEHHIKEEEHEMFKRARKLMEKDELDALGERLQQRKNELVQAVW
jgi:hemerythrin-like domain-containing protein